MIVAVLVLVANLNGVDVPIFTGAVFASMDDCQKYVEKAKTLVPLKNGQYTECRPSTLKIFKPQ
jgi:hypothetical protein